eukprot:gene346-6760_t
MTQYTTVLTVLVVCLIFSIESKILDEVKIYSPKTEKFVSRQEFSKVMSESQLIFGGEYHDHDEGHELQLELTKMYHQLKKNITLSLEMFERDVQKILTLYLKGEMSEASFLSLSRPWPNYPQHYKPLVEYMKKNRMNVLAANIPRRYASFVSNKKENILFSMPEYELNFISKPPIYAPIDAYFIKFNKTMGPRVPPERIYQIYRAQCIKDDTMAMSIVDEFSTNKNLLNVISFQGCFHSDEYLGLFDRVHRKLPHIKKLLIKIDKKKEMGNLKQYKGYGDFILFV